MVGQFDELWRRRLTERAAESARAAEDEAAEAEGSQRGLRPRRRPRSRAYEAWRRAAAAEGRRGLNLTPRRLYFVIAATVLIMAGIFALALTHREPGGGFRSSGSSSRPFPRKNGHQPACPNCDGTGVDRTTWNQSIPQICENCGGTGVSPLARGFRFETGNSCPVCGGSGWAEMGGNLVQQCPACNGTGRLGGRAGDR